MATELRRALTYFRENNSEPPVSKINFHIHWRPNHEEKYYVEWTPNSEDACIDLAISYGSIVGAFNRSSPDNQPIVFLWFNNDSNISYEFDSKELDNFPPFLDKVKFAIENYLGFYQ